MKAYEIEIIGFGSYSVGGKAYLPDRRYLVDRETAEKMRRVRESPKAKIIIHDIHEGIEPIDAPPTYHRPEEPLPTPHYAHETPEAPTSSRRKSEGGTS